ncbi:ParA family protein [Paenarthrobacter ureafaciens]|uniref:ParA family protein n=1 Tax=Paenarthrobacter ureafaciens TaxID=37931 RepID=UPI00140A6EEA|nr:ParA family protein [Paenarthrobacter ureafaciens]MCX8456544.1 ParA family protein [Paenarthrobacter ureafaciens]MCY0974407.1 ParA family protein [Paenarthrobacter ureafaciens]
MTKSVAIDRTGLERVCALVNGKGGVLKTTLTANLGGLLAVSGWHVLLVDFDPQGNLGLDLGYRHQSDDDDGLSMAQSLMFGAPLKPLKNVRPNLDVVPGGSHLDQAAAGLVSLAGKDGQKAKLALAAALSPIAGEYDIIFIDCPPGNEPLQLAALGSAAQIIVPTKTDRGGREGLLQVAKRLESVVDVNPGIDLLGVVIAATSSSARAVQRTVREAIVEAFGTEEVLFENMVRHAEAPAQAVRERGMLVHELEEQVNSGPKWYEVLRGTAKAGPSQPRSAGNVAEDLHRVAQELVARLEAAESRSAS